MQNYWYPPGSSTASSIVANQGLPNTDANGWPVKITDGVREVGVTVSNEAKVADATVAADVVALSNKSASALVSVPFDYQDITYVGASTRIDQVIYKSGGAGGAVVATLTMGYDGSNRLISVTKT